MADAGHFIRYAPNRIFFQLFEDTTGIPALDAATSSTFQVSTDGGGYGSSIGAFNFVNIGGSNSGVYFRNLSVSQCSGRTNTYYADGSKLSNPSALPRAVHPNYGFDGAESGVVVAGSANTMTLRASAPNGEGYFVGSTIELLRGNGQGQSRTIQAYNTSRVATVSPDWVVEPVINDVYVIHQVTSDIPTAIGLTPVDLVTLDGSTQAAILLKSLYNSGLEDANIFDILPLATSFKGSLSMSAVDGFYDGQMVVMTSGILSGKKTRIADYVGITRLMTFTESFFTSPANGDSFVILARKV